MYRIDDVTKVEVIDHRREAVNEGQFGKVFSIENVNPFNLRFVINSTTSKTGDKGKTCQVYINDLDV